MRAIGLGAIYLLVLTSVDPVDIATALLIGLGLALLVRPRAERTHERVTRPRPLITLRVLWVTALEVVVGTWRTVWFCLGRGEDRSGFVEIPRDGRSRHNIALWGQLTGEAPDEIVVDIDEDRDVLIVHLVDASDPDAVRERHARTSDLQRKAVP